MRHMDFSAMISKSPKVTTLAFGRSTSTQAQLQDLEGIVGPSMQGRPEVHHFFMAIWLEEPSGRPFSTEWLNDP